MINVEVELNKTIRTLDKIVNRQLPFALSQAINDTAFKSRAKVQQEMPSHIDRPTPFTIRGVKVDMATRKRMYAYVYIDKIQEEYLKYQIDGGTRQDKEGGRVIVPVDMKLNAYGNIPGKRTGVAKGKRFGAVRKGVKGIWTKQGRGKNKTIKLVAAYSSILRTYRKIKMFNVQIR